jgi:hypothetical protein
MDDELIRNRLLSGERIVWSGRPGQGLILSPRDTLLIPFSLVWCGFAVFWTVGASSMGAPSFFDLWGAMFICIGLYFVFGRFLVDAWMRRGMRYAVTDRRVLIARAGPFSKLTAIGLNQLPDVNLNERRSGRGTIRFGQQVSMWGNRGMGGWTPALDPTPQFIAIEDAHRIFDLIQRSASQD